MKLGLMRNLFLTCFVTLLPACATHAQSDIPKPQPKPEVVSVAPPAKIEAEEVAPSDKHKRKPDLGDVAQGTYFGDVISDSKGSSQTGVTVTVTRIGKNLVRITSDYARLPSVEVPLSVAMGKVLNARGTTTFLLDRAKRPTHLDISFLGEVSWSGARQSE